MTFKSKITSKLNIVILIVLSFLVLYFSLKDDFVGIIQTIMDINFWWFFIGVILMFGYWFFRSLAFHRLVLKFDSNYDFKRTFGLIMLTQFFNGITPFATGGQPLVAYTLKKDGLKVEDSTNIVVQDFITYQIALIILGIIAILYNYLFNIFIKVQFLKEIVLIGFIVNVAVVLGLFMVAFARKFNQTTVKFAIKIMNKLKIVNDREKLIDKWEKKINDFHDGASILMEDKKHFAMNILINIFAMISLYAIPLAILFSMRDYHSLNIVTAIVSSAYVMLVSSFIPSPGSVGGIEFAFVAFFSNFVKGNILSAMMLLWRVLTYYLGLTIGAIVFNVWRKRE
jgi:uncharacterized protein (TIRG00374 family)